MRTIQDTTVIAISVISFLLILSLTAVITIIIICRIKLRTRTSDATEIRGPHARVEKQEDNIKKEDVPVASNKAYAIHNVSRCIKVSTNEAYAVSRNDEPVYELVK